MLFSNIKHYRCMYFVLVLAIFLSACGKSGALDKVSPAGTILSFGDSLTSGVGVSSEDSYPSVLAKLSKRAVINAGISGELTEEGLARLESVLDETSPELMILLEGGNDILQNKSLQAAKQNLSQMITLAKAKGVLFMLNWLKNMP